MPTDEEFFARFERLGEEGVRLKRATKFYGDAGRQLQLVDEWLRRKDQSRSEEASREQRRNARHAKNAAIAAATAAIVAAICAVIAVIRAS
jgi:hypothetical protein